MSQRKLYSERLIKVPDFDKNLMVKFLKDRELFGTVSKAKGYILAIVYEFYVNLYKNISDPTSSQVHKAYVRGHVFDFSPALITMFLGCASIEIEQTRTLDYDLDMDVVTAELTEKILTKWLESNYAATAKLTVKYVVLFKIVAIN